MEHSIKISKEACQGCVNCIRVCPTEAIRVVDGEISIIEELCIDCGECLRSCHFLSWIFEYYRNSKKESSRPHNSLSGHFIRSSAIMAEDNLETFFSHLTFKTHIDEAEYAFTWQPTCSSLNQVFQTVLPLYQYTAPLFSD